MTAYESARAMVALVPTLTKIAITAEAVRIARIVFEPDVGPNWDVRDLSGLIGGESWLEETASLDPAKSPRRNKYTTSGKRPYVLS